MWKKLWKSTSATVLIALVAFVTLVALPALASARTLLTIADGPVQVLRGTQRLAAAEGMVLIDEDIVRTTAGTRVARIEWADGRVLDLGPGTEAMLASDRIERSAELAGSAAVLLRGWAKLAAGSDSGARLAAPGAVARVDARGALLLHAGDDGALVVFAESRAATIAPRANAPATPLREGQTWARESATAAGVIAPRQASLGEVPRALADALPRRAGRFAERDVPPSAVDAQDANELAAWWRAEPALMALVHPRAAVAATKKKAAPTRVAAKPKPHAPEAVVVPGLPLPVGSGAAAPVAAVLAGSPLLADERISLPALPPLALPTMPPAPNPIAPPTKKTSHKKALP